MSITYEQIRSIQSVVEGIKNNPASSDGELTLAEIVEHVLEAYEEARFDVDELKDDVENLRTDIRNLNEELNAAYDIMAEEPETETKTYIN